MTVIEFFGFVIKLFKFVTKTISQGPHTLQMPKERPGIMPNVLHAIGNTPLVRINRIAQSAGLKCEMCKCNYILTTARIGYIDN